MEPLIKLKSVACALPQINIDTDQVFPARFMKEPRTKPEGYAPYLFHDIRRNPDGALNSEFPLNKTDNRRATILVARRNFGSGSSREAAVYALTDAGIRCVIAPSHGDIFAANSVNNGLLPACINESDAEALLGLVEPGGVEIEVDLSLCRIFVGTHDFGFKVDPVWRIRLLNGWDDIDMTRRIADEINAWSQKDSRSRPWAQLSINPR